MVEEEFAALISRFPRSSAPWRLSAVPIIRRAAEIYRFSAAGARNDAAIKVFADPGDAKRFYMLLRKMYVRRTPVYQVPRPYGYAPPLRAVAMFWVKGDVLGDMLLAWRLDKKRRAALIAKSGGWLRWFHDGNLSERRAGDPSFFIGQIDRYRKTLLPAGLPAFFVRGYNALTAAAPMIADTQLEYGRPHGDFTPYNIFMHGSKAIGIDFQSRARRPLVLDVCRMTVSLGLHRYWPTSRAAAEDTDCFIRAYGAGHLPEGAAFIWLQLAEALRRWGSLAARGKKRWRFRRWLERRRLQATVIRLTSALNAAV